MLETLQKTTDEQAAREQEAVIRNVIGITYGGMVDLTVTVLNASLPYSHFYYSQVPSIL